MEEEVVKTKKMSKEEEKIKFLELLRTAKEDTISSIYQHLVTVSNKFFSERMMKAYYPREFTSLSDFLGDISENVIKQEVHEETPYYVQALAVYILNKTRGPYGFTDEQIRYLFTEYFTNKSWVKYV